MAKVEIKVPAMGESITEATVGAILKPAGSTVAVDEEVLELETDKVNQVLYAGGAGVISLSVKEEDVVKIGQVIGHIDSEGAEEAPKEEPKEEKVEETKKVESEGAAKRISKEDFLEEKETPVTKDQPKPQVQVQEAAPMPVKIIPGRDESRQKMSKIRKVIAKRLVEAQQGAAMLTTFNEVDMTEVMELRARYKDEFLKKYEVKLGFMSFFVKACVSALQAIPEVNSYIDGEELVTRHFFDIGIAVGTERGLVVPVVRDCDKRTSPQIEQAILDYAEKARKGGLSVDDLQGGGFTITNGGIYGSLLSTPILNPPQSGILGMHKIEKRPVVIDDQIVIRPMMYLALSYDHRVIDGKEAVSFLVHVKQALEDPSRLLIGV